MLRLDFHDGVAVVTMDRPQALNALSRALRGAIAQAFDELERNDAIRVIVLTGAGRGFCSGLDLKELVAEGELDLPGSDPVMAILRCSKPIIGAINGPAVTGGFELALACDILLASTQARFADTHARVGILPGWGLSQKLARLVGLSRAKEMSFSGNYIDAATACAWGLVNRVVEPDALLDQALALARDIASTPTRQLRQYKRLIDTGYAMSYGSGLALENLFSNLAGESATKEGIGTNAGSVFERGREQAGPQ